MYAQTLLAHYDLEDKIAAGPVTQVFSAKHIQGDFRCAIKLLRSEWADDLGAQECLRREAQAGFAVRHPGLVKLLDAHLFCDPFFIVTALTPGESLRTRIGREFSIKVPQTISIAAQLAEALAALHQAGFVHADLKPATVWICNDGAAMISDLCNAHRPGQDAKLVQEGYLFGLPEYLAPELCDGKHDHAFGSDWYSFGLMLLEMLTGELPGPATGGPLEILIHQRECNLTEMLQRTGHRWPARLTSLLKSLLRRELSDRPTDAQIVAELVSLEQVKVERYVG